MVVPAEAKAGSHLVVHPLHHLHHRCLVGHLDTSDELDDGPPEPMPDLLLGQVQFIAVGLVGPSSEDHNQPYPRQHYNRATTSKLQPGVHQHKGGEDDEADELQGGIRLWPRQVRLGQHLSHQGVGASMER